MSNHPNSKMINSHHSDHKDSLNKAKTWHQTDLYLSVIRQNKILYILIFVFLISFLMVFLVLFLRPVPVLMVDEEGRYLAKIDYLEAIPLNESQIEAMSKRFVQHYLSQNSATIYEDAEISLSAMCEDLRLETRNQWLDPDQGKLLNVVERVQVSRVIFSDFELLEYLGKDNIQLALTGQILLSNDDISDRVIDFNLELAMRLVPISANNYLGIEICSVRFV